jgi:anaerobic selenocysteine-containing dehydrogenase
MSTSSEKATRTICGFCHVNCGLIVHVKNGVITKIEPDPHHPVNMGEACPKGLAGKQVVYAPDRLKYPLVKTSSGFEQTSWDNALDIIADKLLTIRDKYDSQTIVRGGGAPVTEENRDGFAQLFQALGSTSYTGAGHLCHLPRDIGFQAVFGHMPQPDYEHAKLMVLWGANPFTSRRCGEVGIGFATAYGKFSEIIQPRGKRKAKLIVISPYRNKLADIADKWLRILPGTDAALLLSMLNVIIKQGLYDNDFVNNWTTGFEQLAEHVQPYTPEWAAEITGIKATDIIDFALLYSQTRPATIREGNGLDQHPNSVNTARLIASLIAVTGNLDKEGGNVFFPYPRLNRNLLKSRSVGSNNDIYPYNPGLPFPLFADAVLTGEPFTPRALIVNHANPALVQSNGNRARAALEKLDFLVVCDIFKTATAELADVILPVTTMYEAYGFRGYASPGGGFFALRNKVIEPIGESMPVFETEFELSKRMGLAAAYPWQTTEEWITARLAGSGVTFNDLKEMHIAYTTKPMVYRKYLKEGFKTDSGKVELYSRKFELLGYDPLPEYRDPDEGLIAAENMLEKYPLIGTTFRESSYVHSQFRNIPALRKLAPEQCIRMNPADAFGRGLKDGQMATVTSPSGEIKVQAKITEEVPAGLVLIDFGWGNPGDGGANVNVLSDDKVRDPVSCSTSNQRFRCQVAK